jgi:2-polyprenyl-6-methoxyphenol hydroxylase-like FAD-dependent oxidoreductase
VAHLGAEHLHLGRTVAGYDLGAAEVRARFADGSAREADLVVGADGIHSACRRQLLDDGEPRYSGYFCWRGIAPSPGALGDDWAGEVWGRGTRFGGCGIDGGRFYWFAVANGPPGGADPPGQARAAVLERFAAYSQPIRDAIAATPEAAILRADIADRPPVTTWGQGRLTLLGDAAHPMTPNLGQGACQAIEDALVLGVELARDAEVDAALRRYERARQPRANQVVTAARRIGAVGQWSNPAAIWLRNGMVRLTPASMIRRRMIDAWRLPYGGFC